MTVVQKCFTIFPNETFWVIFNHCAYSQMYFSTFYVKAWKGPKRKMTLLCWSSDSFLENWPFTQSWKSVQTLVTWELFLCDFQTLKCRNETSLINQWGKVFYEGILLRIEQLSRSCFSKGEDNLWCERYGGNKKAVFLLVQPQMGRKWLSLS